ncbi:MAG TPA: protein prkA [Thermodesulfobacteriota bacterium]|nr:protein prkA [Thermodesulfobacteriota bacterium]
MAYQDFSEKSFDMTGDSRRTGDDWEGTCLDYLERVRQNPVVAQLAPARVYNMILRGGTQPFRREGALPRYEDLVQYNLFKDRLFGLEEPLHEIVRFIKAGARGTETGKRILVLVGPASSGKSTIVSLLKDGLQKDDTPLYAVKNCPIHEEPLHLIPRPLRPKWEEVLGVKIEGDLCPACRFNLLKGADYRDPECRLLWETYPVVRIRIGERCGIGTFRVSETRDQEISELIGRADPSKVEEYGETDPRAYRLDGQLAAANRGLMEYADLLKCDVKFHYVLLSVAQERVLKAPGFPHIYIDEVILGETNPFDFEKFKSAKENEALHDRMYPVFVPYNLRAKEEEKICLKLIARSPLPDVHFGPHAIAVAARFAVLTRLTPSSIVPDLFRKMRAYDGEGAESAPSEVVRLRLEGKERNEGMSGLSSPFVGEALCMAAKAAGTGGCVGALEVIRAIREKCEGLAGEEKTRYIRLLSGERDSVLSEFRKTAREEVSRATASSPAGNLEASIAALKERGYCDACAERLLVFVKNEVVS